MSEFGKQRECENYFTIRTMSNSNGLNLKSPPQCHMLKLGPRLLALVGEVTKPLEVGLAGGGVSLGVPL